MKPRLKQSKKQTLNNAKKLRGRRKKILLVLAAIDIASQHE